MKEKNKPESELSGSDNVSESERPYVDVGERLRQIRGGMSQEGFASRLQVSKRTIVNYEGGQRFPEANVLRALSEEFAVNLDWVFSGMGSMRSKLALRRMISDAFDRFTNSLRPNELDNALTRFVVLYKLRQVGLPDWFFTELPEVTEDEIQQWNSGKYSYESPSRGLTSRQSAPGTPGKAETVGIREDRSTLYNGVSPEDFVFVARYDAEVSAGHGAFLEEDQVRDRLAFKRSWIREMGLQPDKLALVTVKGDSMEPNLFHGDIVLVDLSTPGITVDGIYVLRTDDGLVVKRLQRMITGDIYIKSDNPAYEVQTVPHDRLDQVRILGRAVWLGRHL
jgi:phage repressor protein C with HTH and peptisase S24 domain/DNA-binding XRE family transcriptional regulator